MKKVIVLTLLFALLFSVGCSAVPTDGTTASQTASTSEPKINYAYTLEQIGAEFVNSSEVEGSLVYFNPSVSEAGRELHYQETTIGYQRITEFDFPDGRYEMRYFRSRVSFPSFPAEYGSYAVHNTVTGTGGMGAVYIRESTNTPIYIHRASEEPMFGDLDLDNRSETVEFAKECLEKYTDLSGYTVSVHNESKLLLDNGRYVPGVCVEYNLTIDGVKTNCYARMLIASSKKIYRIVLCNEIEDVIAAYANTKIDVDRMNALIKAETDRACETNYYSYEGYESDVRLMVLDGKLKAYAEVNVKMYEVGTKESVYVPPITMLIEVASFETE